MKPGDKYKGGRVGDLVVGVRETPDGIEVLTGCEVPEGRPIGPDDTIITARMTEDGFEVTDVHEGPSRANSAAYREGYDRIFGSREPTLDPQELN